MEIFEDLLSNQRVEQAVFSFAPELRHRSFRFEPPGLRLEITFAGQRLSAVSLDLQINTIQQAMKLSDLFKACGYQDMREVSAMMYTPNLAIHLFFTAKPETIANFSGENLNLNDPADIFELADVEGRKLFTDLDAGYDFIKIEARAEQPTEV